MADGKGQITGGCVAKLLCVIAVSLAMISCSTTTKIYSGPERPAGEVALIKPAEQAIEIVRCDGVKISGTSASVLPGDHTVEVTYSDRISYLMGTPRLGWKAEAGHTYVVERQHNTAPGMSSMYIVDKTTGKTVSSWLSKAGEEIYRLKLMEEKTKEFPQYSDFWAEKGYLLVTLKRFDEATPAVETALSLKPENAYAWWVKGLCFYRQEQYKEALAAIDKAIQFRGNEADKKFREEILKKIEGNNKRTETTTAQ